MTTLSQNEHIQLFSVTRSRRNNMSQHSSLETYKNNIAASFMDNGKYRDAIDGLSRGIIEVSCHECEGPQARTSCCDSRDGVHVLSLDQCMRGSQENFKQDGTPYLYKTPIRIPYDSNMMCDKQKHDIVSAVMVFNLALSHHLQALEYFTPKDIDFHLQKAMILYELAFDIQKKEHFDSNYVFVLAIVNNLSMIHQRRKNTTLANEGFRHMLSILMYLVDSGQHFHCGTLEGFQYNVSLSTSLNITTEHVAVAA